MLLLALGIAIVTATWFGIRRLVGAPLFGTPGDHHIAILRLDAYPPFAGFALGVLGTARPLLAALAMAATGGGLAVADVVKRQLLREPALFSDRSELIELVRHPRLYLAFIGTGRAIAVAIGLVLVIAAFFRFEPPLWHLPWWVMVVTTLGAMAMGRALFVLPGLPPLIRHSARRFAAWAPSRDPAVDATRFGLVATFIVHATFAAVERADRQRAAQARSFPPLPESAGPILLIQAESFMDAGRIDPIFIPMTANFRALQAASASAGRLEVPCWGANTIRSELAMLSGLGERELGLDRFNPYEYFARVPLPSLARAARAAGYRTICVHPYQRSFYARDRVMPILGFDEFIGIEGFTDAPTYNGYVTDVAMAERVAALVREHGPKLLVFAISMENHGPWSGSVPGIAMPERVRDHGDSGPLSHWLRGLSATDAMIPILKRAIEEAGSGWLLFYGDHQPSLHGAFGALGHDCARTDYAIWNPLTLVGARRDLRAEELSSELLTCIGPVSEAEAARRTA